MIVPHVASAFRRAVKIAALDRPRVAAWTLVAATCALVVAGIALVAADNVDRWSETPRHGSGNMVVYLGDGVDEAGARRLAMQLAALPGVERAELVAAADSAKRLEQALGADAALLDGVDLASLPASVEVTLSPGVRDVIAMSPTLRALRGTAGVDDVVVEAGDHDAVTGAIGTVRTVVWTGAGVLALLALAVVIATLRVRLERDRQEQRVHHLLGAAAAFTAIPTALAGAMLGAVAACLAAFIVWLGIARYGDSIASVLGSLGQVSVGFPAISAVLVFVAFGAGLGFLGGGLAGAARVAR